MGNAENAAALQCQQPGVGSAVSLTHKQTFGARYPFPIIGPSFISVGTPQRADVGLYAPACIKAAGARR